MYQSKVRSCAAARWATLLAVVTSSAAWGGSFEIGDADVVEAYKVDGLVTYERAGDHKTWERPAFTFGMGLGETVEFNVGTGYGEARTDHGDHRNGLHDAFVALKWRLADEDPDGHRPAWAIEPDVVLPTGNRRSGMSDGVTTLTLPVRAVKHYGNVRLTGQASYSHTFGRDEDGLSYGVLYEYILSPQLSVGMEALNDVPLHDGGDRFLRGHVGIRWNPIASMEVHGLLGRAWPRSGGENEVVARFGVEYQFD